MIPYRVKRFDAKRPILVDVPASKSILNRALILSALSRGDVLLRCGALCDDTKTALRCLGALGVEITSVPEGLLVHGTGGTFRSGAVLDVRDAGTAARFLPAVTAFCGGTYEFRCSEQMSRRPMAILKTLEEHGARFEFEEEEYRFPFRMHSDGLDDALFTADTEESTQYASGLLLGACTRNRPTKIRLTGPRARGSYLKLTRDVMASFGHGTVAAGKDDEVISVLPSPSSPGEYTVEPDLSSACYFFALSLICGARVTVRGVKADTVQGDARLLQVLREKGVRITQTPEGLCADGRAVPLYNGIDVDLRDFSDQALTVAALALFAEFPSILRGIGHTRNQESDRIASIVENVNALGAHSFTNGEDVFIEPAPLKGGTVRTFGDHRVAMAFSLVGLRTGNIVIDDSACCSKTFPDFFSILDSITQ